MGNTIKNSINFAGCLLLTSLAGMSSGQEGGGQHRLDVEQDYAWEEMSLVLDGMEETWSCFGEGEPNCQEQAGCVFTQRVGDMIEVLTRDGCHTQLDCGRAGIWSIQGANDGAYEENAVGTELCGTGGSDLKMSCHGPGVVMFQYMTGNFANDAAFSLSVDGEEVYRWTGTSSWANCKLYLEDFQEYELAWHLGAGEEGRGIHPRAFLRNLRLLTPDFFSDHKFILSEDAGESIIEIPGNLPWRLEASEGASWCVAKEDQASRRVVLRYEALSSDCLRRTANLVIIFTEKAQGVQIEEGLQIEQKRNRETVKNKKK